MLRKSCRSIAAAPLAPLFHLLMWPLLFVVLALVTLLVVLRLNGGFAGLDHLLENGGVFVPYFVT
jgi:hypothetical protein